MVIGRWLYQWKSKADMTNMTTSMQVKIGAAFAVGSLAVGGWAFAAGQDGGPSNVKVRPASETSPTTTEAATTTAAPTTTAPVSEAPLDQRVGQLEGRVDAIEATTTTTPSPSATVPYGCGVIGDGIGEGDCA